MVKRRIRAFKHSFSYVPAVLTVAALAGLMLLAAQLFFTNFGAQLLKEFGFKTRVYFYKGQQVFSSDQVEFPVMLSPTDRTLYREIYALQKKNKWSQADAEIKRLQNPILVGHVLKQRYIKTNYVATPEELKEWVESYSDHPDAHKVYKLATKKDPNLASLAKEFGTDYLFGYGDSNGLSGHAEYYLGRSYWGKRTTAYNLWKRVHRYVRSGRITSAYQILQSAAARDSLKDNERYLAQWAVATGYFAYGKNRLAYMLAVESADKVGKTHPPVYWTAGIVAWKLGSWEEAARQFSKLAASEKVSRWERSAGAFWAYRAYKELGKPKKASEMLAIAVQYPRTFYGLIANIAAGSEPQYTWQWEPLDEAQKEKLLKIPTVRRALAFLEIDKRHEAEKELRRLFPKMPLETKRALLAFVREVHLPALQVRMARMISSDKNGYFDHALYPIPHWGPRDDFSTDPALIFALMRQESGFNTGANSQVGARGLMQMMPSTAKFIAEKNNLEYDRDRLLDPEYNVTLAQDYLEFLLGHSLIDKNLFYLLAAYNAGHNKLAKWLKEDDYNDPLLFIESIPSKETRNFIEQSMTNYWIYRIRFGRDVDSLENVLDERWPLYED